MKTRRQGYVLIECLMVIGMAGVALGTIAMALHALYRMDCGLREQLALCGQLDRLAWQLRGDTHQASSATLRPGDGQKGETARLVLTLPGERFVEYAVRPTAIERLVRRRENIEGRESYRLPGSTAAQWHMEDGGAVPVVSLHLRRQGNRLGGRAFPQTCRIAATLRVAPSTWKPSRP